MATIGQSRWRRHLLGALAIGLVGLLVPSAAFAEDPPTRGSIALQPVTLEGTTYKPIGDGPFKDAFKDGLDASKTPRKHATATVGPTRKPDTAYPWGSVGADNGSFIQNKTGKPMCKFVMTSTDGSTFDKGSKVGDGWKVDVSADGKTITIWTDDKTKCIPDGGYFWMKVPKAPQPSTGKSTLQGKFYDTVSLGDAPVGDDTAVAIADESLFEETLAQADVPGDPGTAVVVADPSPSIPTDADLVGIPG